jgi:hypothetical protein
MIFASCEISPRSLWGDGGEIGLARSGLESARGEVRVPLRRDAGTMAEQLLNFLQ